MNRLTGEEMNLLSIYKTDDRWESLTNMAAALPLMEPEMQAFAERTMKKLSALSDAEYAELAVYPAGEAK